MSIRRTIESLLGDEQQQEAFRDSPEAFFADHGMEDLPGELIGTAFVHYSDTAPIEHGDAVAGIATHYSDVPFEAEDLPGHAESDGGDPFASLGLFADDTSTDVVDDGTEDQPNDPEEADVDPIVEADGEDGVGAVGNEAGDTSGDADEIDSADFHDNTFDDGFGDPTLGDELDDELDDSAFDDRTFDDGFDEAEALDHDDDSGFGDGMGQSSGPTEILGEIHGDGMLDPGIDDPFFEEVTEDGLAPVQVAFDNTSFDNASFDSASFDNLEFEQVESSHDLGHELGTELGHDGLGGHHAEIFDDIDPGLDLDDL